MASIIKVDTIQDQDGNNIINENANTITIGKSGDTVQVAAGAEFVGGGTQWQSSIVTGTTLSAVAGNGYWIDTTSNACTVTLPASASVGDTIEFADYARTWNTNNVTINPNSLNYQGNTSPNPTLSTIGQHLKIVYSGATQGWIPTNDDPVALGTPQSYSAEYLVIAGGGSAGSGSNSGGGGAGGYLTNYGGSAITFIPGTTYTVTVGSGGATSPSNTRGTDGGNSVLSGTGISTVTAIGGSGGGYTSGEPAYDGGSGGGGANGQPGGSGTVGQGNDGGNASNSAPHYGAGGGGGASNAGANGTGSGGGNGGDGSSNSITGSAVTYAGGGGGSADASNNVGGTGGAGGGGNGASGDNGAPATGPGGNATDGLGAGGGGGIPGGSGGNGVVFLRVPTASYSGTTTGSPTVTTDGTDTIMQFTGSGSYTG